MEQLWIVGDDFVARNNAAENYFIRMDETISFAAKSFETKVSANSEFTSNNKNILARLRNTVYHCFNKTLMLPKLIVIVIENDLIKFFNSLFDAKRKDMTEDDMHRCYTAALRWIMSEFRKFVATIKEDYLPAKGKKADWPYFIWIVPCQHVNFRNSWAREIFTTALYKTAKGYPTIFVLELKQVWDPEDSNLVLYPERRITVSGLNAFWLAVDRTIRFANSLINRKEFAVLSERYKNDEDTTFQSGQEPIKENRQPNYYARRNNYDRFHYRAKGYGKKTNQGQGRRLPPPP